MTKQQSHETLTESQIKSMMRSQGEQPNNYNAASNNKATMLVILIIGFTAGPAVSL